MDLSIVITTRNRKIDLLECIDSIKESDLKNIEHELIIVDDASDDGTGSSQFIFTDAGNDCDDDGITVRREVDNGSCTIVGKTNFYFE